MRQANRHGTEHLKRSTLTSTDLYQFGSFFHSMGVTYCVCPNWDQRVDGYKGKPTAMGVSQAWFMFTKKGDYLGVMDDEMGVWHPRESVFKTNTTKES